MTFRWTWGGAILGLLGCDQVDATTGAAEWLATCDALKATLGEGADMRFTARVPTTDAWASAPIRFRDLTFLVPDEPYDVRPSREENGFRAVALVGGRSTIAILLWEEALAPIDDIFAKTSATTPTTKPDGRAFTQRGFGPDLDAYKLEVMGYDHDRTDITCGWTKPDEKMAAVLVSLQLKAIHVGLAPISVHYDALGLGEILKLSGGEEGQPWAVDVTVPDGERVIRIQYRTQDEATARRLLGAPLVSQGTGTRDAPEWAEVLSTALVADSAEAWGALGAWQEAAGGSQRSRADTAAMAARP